MTVSAIANAVVPVAIKGFSVNSGLLAVIATGVITIAGLVIRHIGPWTIIKNTRRKDEIDRLAGRVKELEDRVEKLIKHADAADERAHRAELQYTHDMALAETKISRAATAVQLLIGEVERLSEGNTTNPIIKQARDLIAMAAQADAGFEPHFRKLAMLKGVGE